MAIGFIKKIFSFGKGAVEEKPAPPQEAPEAAPDAVSSGAATTPSVPSGHLPHEGGEGVEPKATAEKQARAGEAAGGVDDIAASPDTSADDANTKGGNADASLDIAAYEDIAVHETVPVEDESAPPPISPLVGEMPGRAEGGASPSDHAETREGERAKAATPPSVPSGHLPHKRGDQAETEVTAEDEQTRAAEKAAGVNDIAASPDTSAEDTDTRGEKAEASPDFAAHEDAAADETVPVKDERAPPPISPPVGEMPGRAEGGEAASGYAEKQEEEARAATPPSVPSGHLPHKREDQIATASSLPKGFATADKRPKEAAPAPQPKLPWYQRLRRGLARSSSHLKGQITSLFTKRKLDEATLQDLEDLLIQADLGVETAMRITDTLASERYGKDVSGEDVSRIMAGEITKVLAPVAKPLELDLSHKPHVILVVGVNGTGKTTTIGKLAAKLSGAGLKVMLAAGDTFRAAAIEQLKIWADRTKSDIVSSKLGADAAGLAYEAFQLAREKKSDVLIIDTAGRLQNKAELMAELEKIVRVLGKLDPDAPHTVLQTLDATTGQNALQQVEIFRNVAGVSGLIMTKLDGTARGGILVAISAKHKLPVYFIGVGEGVDDLEPFEAKDFADAIAGVAA
ncbi:fused signal recognition particle receptor [Sinorhizobium terangae]|uniref:Signal recognition particle receptor FtsY n=2 Tax=Sinorhizobium terangae TaxID=110322 RepID=A0A6N7L8Z9_SINTE|nr:signal recognition particle-docking protein FtsY [Sinorhizobium terangae]MBB4186803.1 fused signal recognition particle receptor [Sinorhizobium terangae]MQX13679.1 signal recognition particle-docking protein FtsY [Sinorhizobium terangae]